MAIITDGNYVTSPIANTTMLEKLRDGVVCAYALKAIDGYVLHDNTGDWTVTDEMTGETTVMKAYYGGTVTCGANYDFTASPREFYAVLEGSVPADQIFGGGGNDHEVI
jgi:hypothetical protein